MDLDLELSRQVALRDTIGRFVAKAEPRPEAAATDVVVSHVEVCPRHGTGIMTERLFAGTPGLVSIRSHDLYGGRQEFGELALKVAYAIPSRGAALSALLRALHGREVRRIFCIPYFEEDVVTALALADAFGAAMCTFVMDDNNIEAKGIPDTPLRELLSVSDLRLAISEEMRVAYEDKFAMPFWFMPPLVPGGLVLREPAVPPAEALAERRGVLVGNIWGREWLACLRETVRGSGISLDWYCNAGIEAHGSDAADLARDGIRALGAVPEKQLVAALRRAPWVVVPSGTLDKNDSRRSIARFSLPSRVTYVLATSHAPMLVLGHPDTTAARYVTSRGIGLAAPYEQGAFAAAVAELVAPSSQATMRARAAALAPWFSADGAGDWLRRSLELGRPADQRWERLASERKAAC